MKSRRLTFLLLVYVSLDLSSPFIPGAFNFNPDESIDGVQRQRDPGPRRPAMAPAPRTFSDASPASVTPSANTGVGARRDSSPVNEWLVDVRRAHVPVSAVSALSEDH